MAKDNAKAFLTFTKKEKRGIIAVLLIVAAVFTTAKYIYPLLVKDKPVAANEVANAAEALKEKSAENKSNYISRYADEKRNTYTGSGNERNTGFAGQLFYFDPNTLDAEGWRKLGVREKTAATILNYISKGGKFRTPDDLRKIWGLREDEKDRLVPYVRIAAAEKTGYAANAYPPYEKKVYEKKLPGNVDINTADSAAFDGLPGIGPGYAKRIINFRNRLGGFYKTDQIAETFGLPDSVYQKIKPFLRSSAGAVHKININTATNDELKAHPYIRWQLANVIIAYRKEHGNFSAVSDLKKIMVIDEETYNKISPYLEF